MAGGLWIRDESFMHAYKTDDQNAAMIDAMTINKTEARQYKDFNFESNIYDRARIQDHVQNQNKILMGDGTHIDLDWLLPVSKG